MSEGLREGEMSGRAVDDFEAFAIAAMPRLNRLALALCGDRPSSDDLVQTTLVKLCLAWPKVTLADPFAYARRVMINALRASRRSARWRRERLVATPDSSGWSDESGAAAERVAMLSALRQLAPRQREVVVLRYLEDLSVETVADLLGCSAGNVKRSAYDGLHILRRLLDDSSMRRQRS